MTRKIMSYKDKRDNNLLTTGQRVIEKLDNNPAFPTPPAALEQLKKALPEFRDAMVKAQSRDKEMISIKNDKKAIVLSLMTQLADYVALISNGDRTAILSSGFNITEERRQGTVSVGALHVQIDAAGEATTLIRNIVGANAFMHQYTVEVPGPNTVWVTEGSTKRTYTFKGLTSDKRYWFRVVAIGSGGQNAYSPVVSRAIQ